jgi:glycosyltransferase involved in cell wall biosynthesis
MGTPRPALRICLVYDCLFPWTVGGAERWLRALAEGLVDAGHEVTYLTRLQWDPARPPEIPGVRVVAVSRDEPLYGPGGDRTIGEPVRFGLGVLRHLARHGRDYDVVHTCSFPYFGLLAAAAARRPRRRGGGYRLVTDWFEVWSDAYWTAYVGGPRAHVARRVQRACARLPQHAFCFSELHAERLRDLGIREPPTLLRGLHPGPTARPTPAPASTEVVFAGRLIPAKRAVAIPPAVARAAGDVPGLGAAIFGDGPQRAALDAAIAALPDPGLVRAPGFVHAEVVEAAQRTALCTVLPSSREGYGLVVVESAALGVPTIVVAGEDNAAVELVQDGVNGVVAPSAEPGDLARAIVRVHEAGNALRESTADWYAANAHALALSTSLEQVLATYRGAASVRR